MALPQIIINEIVANNVNILMDDSLEYDDFAEIYNSGTKPVDLAGMYFCTDLSSARRWQVPQNSIGTTWLAPGAFKVIWFDDDEEQGPFHAGFKLNSAGEALYLLDKDGKAIVDSVSFPPQYPDFSYCRLEDNTWSYCQAPSPLAPNPRHPPVTRRCPAPHIQAKGGFYQIKKITVEIDFPEGFDVYFTMDGSSPQPGQAQVYKEPIALEKTTVLRAACFRENYLPGPVVTETFFFDETPALPVVAIAISPSDLYNPRSGLYANPFRDFKKPVNFEYYDRQGQQQLNLMLGMKPFGFTSRSSSKLSFTLDADKRFGPSRIEYAFFPDKPHINNINGLILRADVTSGRGGFDREIAGERIKNELMYHLIKNAGSKVDVQAYQPVVVYLNGTYWGLYNLMEKKGSDFIKNNYGIKNIDMLDGYELEVVAGSTDHYQQLLEYVRRNDVYQDSTVQRIFTMVDKESLVDYWIFEIYSATHDYKVNIRFWRPRTPDGKWRMLAYDEDSWGRYDEPTFSSLTTELAPETLFFWNEMLENLGFRHYFINRFADLLNSVLFPDHVQNLIDSIQQVIAQEKERDYQRWRLLVNFVEPGSQIKMLKEFAEKRPDVIRQDIIQRFVLPGLAVLTLEVEGPGKIQVNTIRPDNYPWQGIYFQGVPVELRAVPESGRKFTGWSLSGYKNQHSIQLMLPSEGLRVKANFK
ncbi:MAG: hypothetical protein KatS3mg031_1045 [Chitinophagales bacterium]|nr:MAG: hypothetical protein KatS3mg031_1045 [Chitinophagales bacterium]